MSDEEMRDRLLSLAKTATVTTQLTTGNAGAAADC
jgi:hypothetical protein